MTKEKILFTEEEAATLLGFSASSLKASRFTGKLAGVAPPSHRKIGTKSIRYHRKDLESWAELNAVIPGE